MTDDRMPPAVARHLDGLAEAAARDERRQHQLAKTFERIHGRPPADDAELRNWLETITARPTSEGRP